jgi:site-specific DNA-cytosine methylase
MMGPEFVMKSMQNRGVFRSPKATTGDSLVLCKWSRRTALDPRHRPQVPELPSTTVRREWARAPQEAHILDSSRRRIRKLDSTEIALIQGFESKWIYSVRLSEKQKIEALGDAVPPPFAQAVFESLLSSIQFENHTFIDICAGAGGLASGLTGKQAFQPLALIDHWKPACVILSAQSCWKSNVVQHVDVRKFDFGPFSGGVGLLIGGPPCQPWSRSGKQGGALDPRDLLGFVPAIVDQLRPEAFVLENVPGLIDQKNSEYFGELMGRLRNPGNNVQYGVLAGILNAVRYRVPQSRKRIFIIGAKGASTSEISRVFDLIDERGSQQDIIPLSAILKPEEGAKGWMIWPYGSVNERHVRVRLA